MIDKIAGLYHLVCDNCGDTETFNSFDEAVDFAKENNWQLKKNKEWENYCPDCREE
jgi:Fe2+ or Zn2+ uptake regulation protein